MIKDIANRVKQLRIQKGYTMTKLAELSDVTRSMISQLEKGEALPSLQTLKRIAEALDISLSEFFYMEQSMSVNEDNLIIRSECHKKITIPGSKIMYNILSPDVSNPMEFLLIEFPPGEVETPFRHSGIEYFYVIEGELTMTLENINYNLHTGDSGCFNSIIIHHMSNNSNKTAKLIIAANLSKEK